MVKPTHRNIASDLEDQRKRNATASQPPSYGLPRSTENYFNDDLLVSLADAYENRRAQQVTEWERHQRVAVIF